MLTTVSANDVDTNPAITYSFMTASQNSTEYDDSDDIVTSYFSIDKFSGKVILQKPLDYEDRQEYQLRISASDMAHVAQTTLTIRVSDTNDNYPKFQKAAYHASLPGMCWKFNLIFLSTSNMCDIEFTEIQFSIFNLAPLIEISITHTLYFLHH